MVEIVFADYRQTSYITYYKLKWSGMDWNWQEWIETSQIGSGCKQQSLESPCILAEGLKWKVLIISAETRIGIKSPIGYHWMLKVTCLW